MPFYDEWKDNLVDYLLHKKNILVNSIPSVRYLFVILMEQMVAIFWWINGIFMTLPLHYVFLGAIATYLSFYVYVKIKYPFWSGQPVIHTYDWWRRYLCKTPYVIQSSPMKLNKYYDESHVKTINFEKLSNKSLRQIRDFLQSHYIRGEQFIYTITRRYIKTMMTGHSRKCYVSTYLSQSSPESSPEIVGCVFSKPISLEFRIKDKIYEEPANVIDFLCVHREKIEQKLIRPLFQTHEKNVRIGSQIPITIFKKEVDLCEGVIPLVKYNTFTFYIERRPIEKLPSGITCDGMELNSLVEFIRLMRPLYSASVLCDIGNIIASIKASEWWAYSIRQKENILGMYIFKNAHITSDAGNGRTIQVVCTIANTQNIELFFVGFLQSLKNVLRINPNVKWIIIEDIGHNGEIVKRFLREKMQVGITTPAALFLYNYVLPTSPINKHEILTIL